MHDCICRTIARPKRPSWRPLRGFGVDLKLTTAAECYDPATVPREPACRIASTCAHAGDRVRKVASVNVFERSSFAPSEMLVPRQCVPIVFPPPVKCRHWPEVAEIWPLKARRATGLV
jgi:hypothetical protein